MGCNGCGHDGLRIKPTPQSDAHRLVEVNERLEALAEEKEALESEHFELCDRLLSLGKQQQIAVGPDYDLRLLTVYQDSDGPTAEVVRLARTWQLPAEYQPELPDDVFDLGTDPPPDDDEVWGADDRVGLTAEAVADVGPVS